jgi:predicted transposase YdaD
MTPTRKPFDAATKQLVELSPGDWLAYLGLSGSGAELIEAEVSTVAAQADRVLRVQSEPSPYLAHVEFQASYAADMGERMLRYNVLLRYRDGPPVRSVLVLLRRDADGPAMTGVVGQGPEPDDPYFLHFGYRIVRVWQKPVESVLRGGLATLPLAPLADVSVHRLPDVVREMETRIESETESGADAGLLWTATYLLMGLTYPPDFTAQLLRGVRQMKESSTYQAILAEGAEKGRAEGEARGKVEEARRLLLRIGGKRLGPPDAQAEAAIAALDSVERLEQMADRLLEVETWNELLA